MKVFVCILLLAIANSVTSKTCTTGTAQTDCPTGQTSPYSGSCTNQNCDCDTTKATPDGKGECLIGTIAKPDCAATDVSKCVGSGIKAECDGSKCKCDDTTHTESGDNCIVTTIKKIDCSATNQDTKCTGYGIKAQSCNTVDSVCDCDSGYTPDATTKDCKASVSPPAAPKPQSASAPVAQAAAPAPVAPNQATNPAPVPGGQPPAPASVAAPGQAGASTQTKAGKTCSKDDDCKGDAYNDKCKDKVCECAKNFWASGNQCTAIGKPCTEATKETTCQGDGYTGKCDNKRCECADGYKKKEDKCDGAMAVVSSAILIAAAALFSRLF